MKKTMTGETFNRGTGLLVVEARLSNINGDPDMNNEPRMDTNGIGLVSPVSIHRKLRDLVKNKGSHWNEAKTCMGLDAGRFDILETRERDRDAIIKLIKGANGENKFLDQYWDARLFGCTFLEKAEKDENDEKGMKKDKNFIRCGVLHFGCGESVRPLDVERLTLTNSAGVEKDKDRGMAPNAYRVARHALYTVPFFVDPSRAKETNCRAEDVELALNLLPYIYSSSQSLLRSQVYIHRAWYVEHLTPMGSCPDHLILDALKPSWKGQAGQAPTLDDYEIPSDLPEPIKVRVKSVEDLMGRI